MPAFSFLSDILRLHLECNTCFAEEKQCWTHIIKTPNIFLFVP